MPKLLSLVDSTETASKISELLETLNQYRHIENFLDKKYLNDVPVTFRLTVETPEQVYEQTIDGSVHFLQPLIQVLMVKKLYKISHLLIYCAILMKFSFEN